jgi:hypothetical protein
MPDYTSLPASGDTDNNLKTLSVTNYSIEPTFDADVLSYEVYVPSDTTKVTVNATTASPKAQISGTGEIEITDEITDVTINVTSEVGETKKYVLTIIKTKNTDNNDNTEPSDSTNPSNQGVTYKSITNILKDSGYTYSNKNITSIKYNVKASTILNNLTKNGASKVVIKNKDNKIITDSALIGTGSTVEITSGNITETYTFIIKGDTSGDGKITMLDLLQVLKHIKGDKKLSGVYFTAADTSKDSKITMLDLLQILKHIKGDKKL